jgi:hypothetical protein
VDPVPDLIHIIVVIVIIIITLNFRSLSQARMEKGEGEVTTSLKNLGSPGPLKYPVRDPT